MSASAAPRISDYALIGDCRSAALIGKDGSIDWLCWPRFDSPSLFAALLDRDGGRWRIAPAAPHQSRRAYLPGTNVLETRFTTAGGVLVLTDLMPAASEEQKSEALTADHEILRSARCESGEVEVEMLFEPRPGYGQGTARLRVHPALGLRVETDQGLLVLRCGAPLTLSGGGARARARLRAGETLDFSLTFADDCPAILPPLGGRTREIILRTAAWWRRWLSRMRYEGPEREAVERSALLLKLLVYAPSGAIVAAPTTSLPEQLGGAHNWDYRYCWLRDASLTVRALFGLGYVEEAEAFTTWLLHSTNLTRPRLRILYDVHGNRPVRERELGHLAGFAGSQPVRIGNAAEDQLQLDVYGEVVDAASQVVLHGGSFDQETRLFLCELGDYVTRNWSRPDEGIWEPRDGRAHHTHSRLLCWTAMDRLVALHDKGHVCAKGRGALFETRARIRRDIEERAWSPRHESYVSTLGGDSVDATLLLLPWYGFEEASSSRMRRTFARVERELGAGDGLLYRYRNPGRQWEGAFGICSFWAVEYLALGGGTLEAALDRFRRLLRLGNDVGLYAEETDPATGGALGNFPQGFTHIGLINAALSIAKSLKGEEPLERTVPAKTAAARPPRLAARGGSS